METLVLICLIWLGESPLSQSCTVEIAPTNKVGQWCQDKKTAWRLSEIKKVEEQFPYLTLSAQRRKGTRMSICREFKSELYVTLK